MIRTKRLALLGGLAAAALFSTLSTASAAQWYCTAHSGKASGWGKSSSLGEAKRIALNECAVRTPQGRYCRITGCR